MKRFLYIIPLLLTLLLLFGCRTEDPTPTPDPTPEHSYFDPTHKTGTYRVDFILQSETVTHYYEAGEIPEPPEVSGFENEVFSWTFLRWSDPIAPVTENTSYRAIYDRQMKDYEATFVMADRTVTVTAKSGRLPELPDVADYNGLRFACWDRQVMPAVSDRPYYAIYADPDAVDAVGQAFCAVSDSYSSGFHNMNSAAALVTLAVQELSHPMDGILAQRIADVIEGLLSSRSGKVIAFDATTNWEWGGFTGAFAIAAATPTVRSRLGESTLFRMETYMRAVAYQIAYNVADANNYSSGPGMCGNYGKWRNPNYRIGNIASLAFLIHYFGEGDVALGAQRLDAMLMGFDETAYDEMLARFDALGWTRAKEIWTTPAPVEGARDAKTLLLYGGAATIDPSHGLGSGGGSGAGVTSGGVPFTYHGAGLSDYRTILSDVIGCTFSGGAVTNDYWYDVNGDGVKERIGYIIDETDSPLLGRNGMMLEFASHDRSSTEYNAKNFTMILTVIHAARHLPLCSQGERTGEVLYDVTEDASLWERVQVGCEDFLYKYKHGYMSYAAGAYYEGGMSPSYEKLASSGYFVMKSVWRSLLLPLGTVAPAT